MYSSDVSVLVRRDQVLDRADLVGRELVRNGLWAARRIIESAFPICFQPGVVSTGGHTEGTKGAAHRKYLTWRRNGSKDSSLVGAVGESCLLNENPDVLRRATTSQIRARSLATRWRSATS